MTQAIYLTERERALPKWAQGELERLRRNIAYAEKQAAAATPENSDVVADPYADSPVYLPRGTSVTFIVDGDRHFNVGIEELADGDRVLNVQGSGGAGPSLAVYPSSSNVVRIKAER